MITIKNLSIIILIQILWISFTNAQMRQGMPNPEERAKRLTEMLRTELKLNDNQLKKVSDILLKYSKKIDTLRNKVKNREEMFEIMKNNQTEQDNEMKKVLTKEQFKTYQKIMEENKNRMRRRE